MARRIVYKYYKSLFQVWLIDHSSLTIHHGNLNPCDWDSQYDSSS